MKIIIPVLTTIIFTALFLILAQSSFGLKSADIYWKPNPWDLTIYSSNSYLIPTRIYWVPLYMLPHKTYEGLGQAIAFTVPYWLIASALPSVLVYLVVKRLTKPKFKIPPPASTISTHSLPSEKSF